MLARVAVVAALSLTLASTPALAQDANYWTNKYGTRSILLNGAVIGGPVDISTMYYNPGGLAVLQNPGVALAVKAFEFANISLPDAGGKGVDLDDPRSSVLPTFVGGLLSVRLLGSDALGYSLFPRQGLRTNMTGRTIESRDVTSSPGPEDLFAEIRVEQDLDETWVGATWSRKLSDRVGFGVSPYVAVRSQRARAQFVAQALGSDGTAAVSNNIQGFQYNHYRVLAKAGISFELSRMSVGLTLTTPGVKIMGSGEAGMDRFRAGQDVNGDGAVDNIYAVTLQQDLPSQWKSPLSIGGGAVLPLGNTTLYLTGEWFDKIDKFDVLDVDPAVDQISGLPVPFEVVHQAKSVTNAGAGLEYRFSPQTRGYVSFSTDYSTAELGKADTALSGWNIYLVTAGSTFAVGKSEFTVGAGYAFGDDQARVPPSLTGTDPGDIGTSAALGTIHYSSFHLIFGFAI